jgi:hypothetical protein
MAANPAFISKASPINGPMPGTMNELRGDNINEGQHEPALGTPVVVPMSDEVKEHQIAQTIRQLFYRARDAKRPIVNQWRKNYRVLNNRNWTARAESWMPHRKCPRCGPWSLPWSHG